MSHPPAPCAGGFGCTPNHCKDPRYNWRKKKGLKPQFCWRTHDEEFCLAKKDLYTLLNTIFISDPELGALRARHEWQNAVCANYCGLPLFTDFTGKVIGMLSPCYNGDPLHGQKKWPTRNELKKLLLLENRATLFEWVKDITDLLDTFAMSILERTPATTEIDAPTGALMLDARFHAH